MYIRRKVFSYGYDENGEQKLFSTTEILNEESYLEKIYSEDRKYKSKKNKQQKEFNSKAQKLLRRASDYKKAVTGQGRLLQGEANQINKGMNSFGNPGNSFIKQGRELNKSILARPNNINTKINQRAGYTHAV